MDEGVMTPNGSMDGSRLNPARKAQELLQNQGVTEPPVDVCLLAEQAGATVIRGGPAQESCGLYEPHYAVIAYHPLKGSTERRRFTVAHELGHHMLHRNHDPSSLPPDHPFELEANAFAAELLVPEEWMRERWSELRRSGGTTNLTLDGGIESLRQEYQVSRLMFFRRILELGLDGVPLGVGSYVQEYERGDEDAVAAANSILDHYNQVAPPVNIEEIAEKEGLDVKSERSNAPVRFEFAADLGEKRGLPKNIFAAALLVPESWLRESWKGTQSLAELSKEFGVREEMMNIRLKTLGLADGHSCVK